MKFYLFVDEGPPFVRLAVEFEGVVEAGAHGGVGEVGKVRLHVEQIVAFLNQRFHHRHQERIVVIVGYRNTNKV